MEEERKKKREREKLHRMQKPNVKAEVYNSRKCD